MNRKEKPVCYICDMPICGKCEMDHFPVPQSQGGKEALPCCLSCHDLKDRAPMGQWSPTIAFKALSGLWVNADRNERLVLAKLIGLLFHQRDGRPLQQSATTENAVDCAATV